MVTVATKALAVMATVVEAGLSAEEVEVALEAQEAGMAARSASSPTAGQADKSTRGHGETRGAAATLLLVWVQG